MNEEPTPQAPEDIPAPTAEPTPPAESTETPSTASDEPSGDMPKWFLKMQSIIPESIFHFAKKTDSEKAWNRSFYSILVGLVFWMFALLHGWACFFLNLAALFGLYYAFLTIKRLKHGSGKLIVSIMMMGVISCIYLIAGISLGNVYSRMDYSTLDAAKHEGESAVASFFKSFEKPEKE